MNVLNFPLVAIGVVLTILVFAFGTRRLLGLYAPVLERDTMGGVGIVAMPDPLPPHE